MPVIQRLKKANRKRSQAAQLTWQTTCDYWVLETQTLYSEMLPLIFELAHQSSQFQYSPPSRKSRIETSKKGNRKHSQPAQLAYRTWQTTYHYLLLKTQALFSRIINGKKVSISSLCIKY